MDILSLNLLSSIYMAESLVLKAVVDMIILNKIFNAFVFSDSLSALRSLTSCSVSATFSRVMLEIKNRLYQFLLDIPQANVKFIWVPSYSGVRENEQVDHFAKFDTGADFLRELRVSFTDFS